MVRRPVAIREKTVRRTGKARVCDWDSKTIYENVASDGARPRGECGLEKTYKWVCFHLNGESIFEPTKIDQ